MVFNSTAEALTISLVIIFILIIVSPLLSKRVRIPVIVIELIFGLIIGRSLLDIIPSHPIIEFFSSFGLVYLMFLVGLEVDFNAIRNHLYSTLIIALFSISVPFLAGTALSFQLMVHPLLLGTIFSTTSLGIILPLSRELEYSEEYKYVLLVSVTLVDVLSIFLLAFALSIIKGPIEASFFYSLIAILSLFLIPTFIRRIRGGEFRDRAREWIHEKTHFEFGVRWAFALIVVLAAVSEWLGFHSIIGSFIAGLIVSELIPEEIPILKEKLASFGYGFFIPLFFIITGAKVNLPLLLSNITNINHLTLIIIVAIVSKVIGVFIATKIIGFNFRESVSFGLFHSARISLIIAAAEISIELGLIDEALFSIFVILAIFSAIFGPSIGKHVLINQKITLQTTSSSDNLA